MKPRLLVLSSTYPRWVNDPEPGFVHELCKRLAGQFEVIVLCPHARGALVEECLDGVKIYRFRYAPVRWEVLVHGGGIMANIKKAPWRLLLLPSFFCATVWYGFRLIRHVRPDVIHAHWIIPQGLSLLGLKILRIRLPPIVITSHGGDLFSLQGRLALKLKRKILCIAARVTVVSHAMRSEIFSLGIDSSRLQVLPMGVDFRNRFTPSELVTRSRYELLFVGRLVEKKGLQYLLKALPAVLEKHPLALLTIVGDGPEKLELEQLSKQLGISHRTQFLGAMPQKNLPDLYRRAALFIAPFVEAKDGDREGLGLVTLEAVACQCPVLVSKLPSVLDVLDPLLDRQCLVEPRKSSIIAARILDVLSDLDEHCHKAIERRERLLRQFDWEIVADNYLHLLKGLCLD